MAPTVRATRLAILAAVDSEMLVMGTLYCFLSEDQVRGKVLQKLGIPSLFGGRIDWTKIGPDFRPPSRPRGEARITQLPRLTRKLMRAAQHAHSQSKANMACWKSMSRGVFTPGSVARRTPRAASERGPRGPRTPRPAQQEAKATTHQVQRHRSATHADPSGDLTPDRMPALLSPGGRLPFRVPMRPMRRPSHSGASPASPAPGDGSEAREAVTLKKRASLTGRRGSVGSGSAGSASKHPEEAEDTPNPKRKKRSSKSEALALQSGVPNAMLADEVPPFPRPCRSPDGTNRSVSRDQLLGFLGEQKVAAPVPATISVSLVASSGSSRGSSNDSAPPGPTDTTMLVALSAESSEGRGWGRHRDGLAEIHAERAASEDSDEELGGSADGEGDAFMRSPGSHLMVRSRSVSSITTSIKTSKVSAGDLSFVDEYGGCVSPRATAGQTRSSTPPSLPLARRSSSLSSGSAPSHRRAEDENVRWAGPLDSDSEAREAVTLKKRASLTGRRGSVGSGSAGSASKHPEEAEDSPNPKRKKRSSKSEALALQSGVPNAMLADEVPPFPRPYRSPDDTNRSVSEHQLLGFLGEQKVAAPVPATISLSFAASSGSSWGSSSAPAPPFPATLPRARVVAVRSRQSDDKGPAPAHPKAPKGRRLSSPPPRLARALSLDRRVASSKTSASRETTGNSASSRSKGGRPPKRLMQDATNKRSDERAPMKAKGSGSRCSSAVLRKASTGVTSDENEPPLPLERVSAGAPPTGPKYSARVERIGTTWMTSDEEYLKTRGDASGLSDVSIDDESASLGTDDLDLLDDDEEVVLAELGRRTPTTAHLQAREAADPRDPRRTDETPHRPIDMPLHPKKLSVNAFSLASRELPPSPPTSWRRQRGARGAPACGTSSSQSTSAGQDTSSTVFSRWSPTRQSIGCEQVVRARIDPGREDQCLSTGRRGSPKHQTPPSSYEAEADVTMQSSLSHLYSPVS